MIILKMEVLMSSGRQHKMAMYEVIEDARSKALDCPHRTLCPNGALCTENPLLCDKFKGEGYGKGDNFADLSGVGAEGGSYTSTFGEGTYTGDLSLFADYASGVADYSKASGSYDLSDVVVSEGYRSTSGPVLNFSKGDYEGGDSGDYPSV